MERRTFLLKIIDEKTVTTLDSLKKCLPAILGEIDGIKNASFWYVEDMVFAYYEISSGGEEASKKAGGLFRSFFENEYGSSMIFISSPGNMRLMYNAIGTPREDKGTVRHRVFITRLKPDSHEEYKKRHDAISPKPGEKRESPTNNFTIWNGGDYICGYAEIDKDYIPPDTEEARQAAHTWETRMLEIMDWLTDDVDHISGERHEKIGCLYKS